jgi:hypothetical protein
MHDLLPVPPGAKSPQELEEILPQHRKLFSWSNFVSGVELENRSMIGTGNGIWLVRGPESQPIVLENDEVIHAADSIVVAGNAPVACLLVWKKSYTSGSSNGYDFSRIIKLTLPAMTKPLNEVRAETVLRNEDCSPRFWVSELETISDDGARILVRRGDEVEFEPRCKKIIYRTHRFDLASKGWEIVYP